MSDVTQSLRPLGQFLSWSRTLALSGDGRGVFKPAGELSKQPRHQISSPVLKFLIGHVSPRHWTKPKDGGEVHPQLFESVIYRVFPVDCVAVSSIGDGVKRAPEMCVAGSDRATGGAMGGGSSTVLLRSLETTR